MIFELLRGTVVPEGIESIVFVTVLYWFPLERRARRKLLFLLLILLVRINYEVFIRTLFLLVLYVNEFGVQLEGLLFFLKTQGEMVAEIQMLLLLFVKMTLWKQNLGGVEV